MVNGFSDFKNSGHYDIMEYFRKKELEELSVHELAYIHLYYHRHVVLKNCTVSSCLHDLIENASAAFGNIRTKQYTPLYICFSILDQLSIFERKDNKNKFQGIKSTIMSFSDLTEDDASALVTLRHKLFHHGSLIGVNEKTKLSVIFRMNPDLDCVVQHPIVPWDGEYRDSLTDNITFINLKRLFRLTKDIVDCCMSDLIKDDLHFSIKCPREYYYKYLFSNGISK